MLGWKGQVLLDIEDRHPREVYPKPVDQSWSEERGVPFWLLRTRDG
jgi:hypothetical protein